MPENRGVPSSSLGLAIKEGPATGGAVSSSGPCGRWDAPDLVEPDYWISRQLSFVDVELVCPWLHRAG